jgi:hypothetical protein
MSAKQQVEIQLEAFQSLLQHPGFALYNEQIKAMTALALAEMKNAKNNEELAKHTYAYLLLLNVANIPEGMAKVLGMQLAAHTKK